MAARVTFLQLAVAAQAALNVRVTFAQLAVAAQAAPFARVTFVQLAVAAEGAATARATAAYLEVMGTGTARASSAAVEVLGLTHRHRASGAVLEVMQGPPLRVSAGAFEVLGALAGAKASSAALEAMLYPALTASSTALEVMANPIPYRTTSAALEALGLPFGAKASAALWEILVGVGEEQVIVIDPATGAWLDLSAAGIPLPRVEYYPAREASDLPAGPFRVGRPRLVLVWDFARPEWLVTMFGLEWMEGRTWTVQRALRLVNIPIFRRPNQTVVREFLVYVWRPEFHRDVEWDMGVWREVRVECPILVDYGQESTPWLPPAG